MKSEVAALIVVVNVRILAADSVRELVRLHVKEKHLPFLPVVTIVAKENAIPVVRVHARIQVNDSC
jgi:hypothetical protein